MGLPRRAKLQIKGLRLEQRRIHLAQIIRDAQRKFGLRENVALEIDAGVSSLTVTPSRSSRSTQRSVT